MLNREEKIMPVTNVITHVRKPPYMMNAQSDTIGIMVEGNMLPCRRDKEKTEIKQQGHLLEQSRPNDHLARKCNPNVNNDKTCKCCGIELIAEEKSGKEESHDKKRKLLACNRADLQSFIHTHKYPLDKDDFSRKMKCKDKKNHCQAVTKPKPNNAETSEETMVGLLKEREMFAKDDQEDLNLNLIHGRGHESELIICTAEPNAYYNSYNNQTYEYDQQCYEQLRDEIEFHAISEEKWKEEAKNILIKMGNNIKIVNNIDKRKNEIRSARLAGWSFAKWKYFTEQNKTLRQKLEKIQSLRELALVRRYFYKWKGKSDIRREEKNKRAEQIDLFLDVLRSKQLEMQKENLEKSSIGKAIRANGRGNEFKNRLDTQNNIIKTQKQKLVEAEEEIKTMKLKQILQQSKISRNIIEENVKETVQQCHPKLRVVAQQIMRIERDKKTSNDKAKQLVESMEQRAQERRLKWQQIQERKKEKAEEQVKLLQEQEAKRTLEEEERKKRKIMELKEKRRQQKENEIKRENERRRLNSLTVIADNFHKKLLKRRAFRAFGENLRASLMKMELAEKFYIYQLKRKCFYTWKFYTEEITTEKEHLTAHFYNYILKRRVLDCFKELYNTRVLNLQVAIDFRDLKIQEKYFLKWKAFFRWRQRIVRSQMKEAEQYYYRKLSLKCFLRWRKLPEIAFNEREKDKRLREWRDKVKEVLPDFVPFEME
uniref:Coiled-coil domain-containing protein 191 n=1 Tax=Cacopsylla melanoneura TaxID=428564 RepID=A0A8D8Z6Y1_9HEMI